MIGSRRRHAILVVALVGVATGCGKRSAQLPTSPFQPVEIAALSPPPRSLRVVGHPPVWIRFAQRMDASTLTLQNVSLKVDTRRLPITLAWEPDSLTLHIQVPFEFELGKTYTIQLRPGIRTATGGGLARAFESQFTMLSVRVPALPFPPPGTIGESPHVPLAWLATERAAGPVTYSIYAGPDSLAVVNRAVAPRARRTTSFYYAEQPWGLGGRIYWSVTAHNDSVGESADGPVWRFDTLAPGTPIDSLDVRPQQYGYIASERVFCNSGTIQVGPDITAAIRWRLTQIGLPLRLAGARVEFTTSFEANPPAIAMFTIVTPWDPCAIRSPGPPYTDEVNGRLAGGVPIGPRTIRIESSALTAHLEATIRGLAVDGYILRSCCQAAWIVEGARDPSLMRIYFYKLPDLVPAPGVEARQGLATRSSAMLSRGGSGRR